MSVETFAITLKTPQELLVQGDFVNRLEAAIAQQLPHCQCLLRWAIVSADDTTCAVEGAYLPGR